MSASGNPPLAGRYVLIDQIGTGGMGSVWRAWDLRLQSWVAAKVLGQHDSGMLLRFVREQSVRIQHPHVVAPSGWAAEDNLVVFTMDLVRGGSISSLLGDHGPLPASYVAVVLDQTLHGPRAVHRRLARPTPGPLRAIGVPPGTPWTADPEPPDVFDQLADVTPPQPSGPRALLVAALFCFLVSLGLSATAVGLIVAG